MELILELPHARAQLFGLELTSLGALLHVQDAHHTGEVDALVGELVDEFEAFDVGLGVQARIAARALGFTRPLDSYTRSVWGCMPVSSAATEIIYSGLLRLSSVMLPPSNRIIESYCTRRAPGCSDPARDAV